MRINLQQSMKMSQQMKLAPRMIQSMEILQLPVMALQERVDQELAENVTLEVEDRDRTVSETEEKAERERAKDENERSESEKGPMEVDNDDGNADDFERLVDMAESWPEDNYTSGSKPSSNRVAEAGDRAFDAMANAPARTQSLHDSLVEQFGYFDTTPEVRAFGTYLIQNLDEDGRLQSGLPDLMSAYGRAVTYEDAERALSLIQKLDPPGVGARSVQECLLLQLNDELEYREELEVLISRHLEDLAANRLPAIQRKTGYDLETITAAAEELSHLNPHPGREFRSVPAQAVTPDLAVDRDDDGNYSVRLLDEYTPNLRISKYYIKQLRNNPDAATKEYIKKKIEGAQWLIESIEQRNQTVKKVTEAIVEHQRDFLDKGPEHIHPLKMEEIAEKVGVHVTTVSRAVSDKWVQTPRGLFPLRQFFGGGTTTEDGEDVSWNQIRLKLKAIIEGEDKKKPLSDDALVEALKEDGYNLARRTVTKYRKKMGIPSSRQRREYV
ncbi:RNA polymerase factor sigma-54 [Alienimonas sp. DA493]|uniref:RNA polymerase factor sigma-54 n=1 Tax=Alienimonas sp. DA493 TaxID=3373605 RepID=UPI0037544665